MDKIKKDRLDWFLDFINMDLGTLSPGDVVKVSTEISLILLGESLDDSTGPITEWAYKLLHEWQLSEDKGEDKGKEMLNLESCQERLSDYLTNMFNVIDEASKSLYGINIKTGEKKIFEKNQLYERFSLGIIKTPVIIESSFDLLCNLEDSDDRVIKTRYKADNTEDTLLIYFTQALDGIPVEAVRQCPECGNWFLHVSKRVKLFCSNKCAAKKVSRERRERIKREDTEAYNQELKNGAKRARKSYEKKVKKKIPKAKIERRPRKH